MFRLETSKLLLLHFFNYFLKNKFIHAFINSFLNKFIHILIKKRLFVGSIYWNGVYQSSDQQTFTYQNPSSGATLGYEDDGTGNAINNYVGQFDEVSASIPISYWSKKTQITQNILPLTNSFYLYKSKSKKIGQIFFYSQDIEPSFAGLLFAEQSTFDIFDCLSLHN